MKGKDDGQIIFCKLFFEAVKLPRIYIVEGVVYGYEFYAVFNPDRKLNIVCETRLDGVAHSVASFIVVSVVPDVNEIFMIACAGEYIVLFVEILRDIKVFLADEIDKISGVHNKGIQFLRFQCNVVEHAQILRTEIHAFACGVDQPFIAVIAFVDIGNMRVADVNEIERFVDTDVNGVGGKVHPSLIGIFANDSAKEIGDVVKEPLETVVVACMQLTAIQAVFGLVDKQP